MLDVIIDGVKYVPEVPKDETTFAVGDFIKLVEVDRSLGLKVGDYGKVLCVAPDGGALGVEFAKPFKEGHALDGLTAWGHGHWFPLIRSQGAQAYSQLEKV